ncbi:Succinate--CoA ligase [Epichloe bromicola]|uniref:Succinate--CoA ligase n=1 Tax=Epichloe bromicola TaxID=79588 RepID=A0ABQ0CZW4_9HYPO
MAKYSIHSHCIGGACVAKFGFDDNADFRQKEIFEWRDTTQEDPDEVRAAKSGLNFIKLYGDIGCLVNGAVDK